MPDTISLEQCVWTFEEAWQHGEAPRVADVMRAHGQFSVNRTIILHELICIDLEYRWRKDGKAIASRPWTVDDYVRELPELGTLPEIPLALIAEEFRVRQRFGDRSPKDAYHNRFRKRWAQLEPLLDEVTAELRQEAYPPNAIRSEPSLHPTHLDATVSYQDFVMQQMVGAGRMGKVYRAWQRSLQREVAVKFLRKSFLNDADAIERFVREARIIGQLRHPNILAVYALGRTPYGGYFMVLDFVNGPDLAKLARQRTIEVDESLCWLIAAADALDHAHQRGIVHCDLKPGNLLLDPDGGLLVADFGLARYWNSAGTVVHEVAGTAPFMAPEQIEPIFGAIGPWTDVYALGAVLYMLLTGQPPYHGQTLADFLAQIVAAPLPPRPEFLRPDIPHQVAHLCMRCLQKDAAARYPNMGELKDALRAAQSK